MAIPDNFDPAPTRFIGGLERMIQLWEALRDANTGGYGGGVLVKIFGDCPAGATTSCSPFTATVIGMMFDAGGSTDVKARYAPKYNDGQLALPSEFYALHNVFYLHPAKNHQQRIARFTKRKWPMCDDPAYSTVFFNLGYEIDPRDMRRGDLVAIDWANGHGHSTFCWDVHLDASGAVDCFQFLSANGGAQNGTYFGEGVSISSRNWNAFFDSSGGKFKKKAAIFADSEHNIENARWYCLPALPGAPAVTRASVNVQTFKKAPKTPFVDTKAGGHAVGGLRVVRFWGFPPPEVPHGTLLGDKAALAQQLARWPQPAPFAMGTLPPSETRIVKQPAAQVARSHPDPVAAAPRKPVQQKTQQVVSQQHFVETALAELHAAGWIDKSPGQPDNVADAASKAATEDFQTKHKCPPVDGIAGPATRAALKRVLDDLHAGKSNPTKPDPKPTIDHCYWLTNRIDQPGGSAGLAVHGIHLDRVTRFEITLTDQVSKRSEKLPVPLVAVNGMGVHTIAIPPSFGLGSSITTSVRGSAGGTAIEKASDVPLYIGPVVPPPATDWPWDEAMWTPLMRNIIAELRRTPRGPGRFQHREITQYGVKEKIAAGDVPVLDKNGRELGRTDKRSLYLADIEGTMRLHGRILNIVKSGNTYDQKVTKVIAGVTVTKPKPSLATFDPAKSRWIDVTDRAPWGSGARLPLIPFRMLAHNPRTEAPLYGRVVYIRQLDGLVLSTGETHNGMCVVGDCGGMAPAGAQFDFFVGREDRHIQIPTLAPSQGGAVCEVELLGMCAAAHH